MYGQRIGSPSLRSMAIRIDLAQLGIPYHMTYVGPRHKYINLHSDPPKHESVRATREHNTPPPYVILDVSVGWVHATLAISHSQCAVVFSHNGIAEISGLLEYVASTTKSRLTQVYNGTVLNQHRRGTTS